METFLRNSIPQGYAFPAELGLHRLEQPHPQHLPPEPVFTQRPRVTVTDLATRRPGGSRRWNPTRGPQSRASLLPLQSSRTGSPGITRIPLSRAIHQPQLRRPLPAESWRKWGRKCVIRRRRHCVVRGLAERWSAVMASSGLGVNAGSSANDAPEIPDNVGDWLRGVYRFATDRNDFRR